MVRDKAECRPKSGEFQLLKDGETCQTDKKNYQRNTENKPRSHKARSFSLDIDLHLNKAIDIICTPKNTEEQPRT